MSVTTMLHNVGRDLVAYCKTKVPDCGETKLVWQCLDEPVQIMFQEFVIGLGYESCQHDSLQHRLRAACCQLFDRQHIQVVKELCFRLGYVTEEQKVILGDLLLHDYFDPAQLKLFSSVDASVKKSRFQALFDDDIHADAPGP